MHADDADADLARYFAELFARLSAAASRPDFESPELTAAVTRSVVAARRAGVRPERIIAYLRAGTLTASLGDEIGDWYRGVLADRFVARAIEAYFR